LTLLLDLLSVELLEMGQEDQQDVSWSYMSSDQLCQPVIAVANSSHGWHVYLQQETPHRQPSFATALCVCKEQTRGKWKHPCDTLYKCTRGSQGHRLRLLLKHRYCPHSTMQYLAAGSTGLQQQKSRHALVNPFSYLCEAGNCEVVQGQLHEAVQDAVRRLAPPAETFMGMEKHEGAIPEL
jgi:hypothetical protein